RRRSIRREWTDAALTDIRPRGARANGHVDADGIRGRAIDSRGTTNGVHCRSTDGVLRRIRGGRALDTPGTRRLFHEHPTGLPRHTTPRAWTHRPLRPRQLHSL